MAKASDNVFPLVRLAPGSAPATPPSGQQVLFIDSADGKPKLKDSSGTVTGVGGGAMAYASYTPTFGGSTTSPTLGAGGSKAGRYAQSGKFTTGSIFINAGTSGFSQGSGALKFGLPAPAAMTDTYAILGVAYWTTGGGTGVKTGFLTRLTATEAQILGSDGAALGAGAATLTNNDVIMIQFNYEAA